MSGENIYDKACRISRQIISIMFREEREATVEVREWLQTNPAAKEVADRLSNSEILTDEVRNFVRQEKAEELQRLWERMRRRRIRRRIVRFSGIAATVALLVGMTLMFAYNRQKSVDPVVEEKNAPILILGNGQNLNLNSRVGEWVTKEGISVKNNQQDILEYSAAPETEVSRETEELNTLIIPCQCAYRVILSDGTIVHLNADSRLEYPVKFMGEERRVRLQGEAYFEVTQNTKPFVVCINEARIKVYGTKFNVNAYHKDCLETVLLEGMVGVSWNDQESVLRPSQLSRLNGITGEQRIVDRVDTDKYISWTRGYLRYDDDHLERMMEDLSRWYGVDFEFNTEDIRNMRVTASINKDLPLEHVLTMIQTTIKVTFIKQERGYLILQPF